MIAVISKIWAYSHPSLALNVQLPLCKVCGFIVFFDENALPSERTLTKYGLWKVLERK